MKVGFIGAGKMGGAITANLLESGVVAAGDVLVSDVSREQCQRLAKRYAIKACDGNKTVIDSADVVFLAVKPQNLDAVLEEISPLVRERQLVVSIAAGKRIEGIEALLPGGTRVVRVMPNLPTAVSEGMSVFCAGRNVTVDDRRTVDGLLSSFGRVLELPEGQFDAVTALSGSGPAFFARFLEVMIEGGIALGLERKASELLATQTMLGTAVLLSKGGYGARELIDAVSSARGTTVAGMAVLEDSPLKEAVQRTLEAAAKRSEELSRGRSDD